MSKAPGPQTLLLQVTHFSLARRWTIQTSQGIDGFDLMTVFEHEFFISTGAIWLWLSPPQAVHIFLICIAILCSDKGKNRQHCA
jgi:hypothetical protein